MSISSITQFDCLATNWKDLGKSRTLVWEKTERELKDTQILQNSSHAPALITGVCNQFVLLIQKVLMSAYAEFLKHRLRFSRRSFPIDISQACRQISFLQREEVKKKKLQIKRERLPFPLQRAATKRHKGWPRRKRSAAALRWGKKMSLAGSQWELKPLYLLGLHSFLSLSHNIP